MWPSLWLQASSCSWEVGWRGLTRAGGRGGGDKRQPSGEEMHRGFLNDAEDAHQSALLAPLGFL